MDRAGFPLRIRQKHHHRGRCLHQLRLDCARVTIGDNALFGPNIGIYPLNHAIDAEERVKGGCTGTPVHIGKRVWLGGDVKILAGVTIGDDTIIGAGSVVTKSIPSGVIAAGNPCRVIRAITDADKTDYLSTLSE